jgi:hypothetical protein
MAVTYTTAVKNARLEAVVSQIGTGGKLEIGTTGMASILATITLENTAGTVSGAVLTFSNFPKNVSAYPVTQPPRITCFHCLTAARIGWCVSAAWSCR